MTEPRIYRASSLGYSLCQLVCGHLGYEAIAPPEWLQEKFDEGTRLEPIIVEELNTCGWAITDSQREINLEIIPGEAIIRGHIDGIAQGKRVIEIKTMNAKTWKDVQVRGWDAGGIIEKYKWQVSAYLLGTGLPVELVAWNKEAKADEQKITTAWTNEPFHTIADMAKKVQEAEEHIHTNTIPDNCTDFPCPYFYLHENKDAIPEEKADSQLDTLMDAWLEANRKSKIYEGEAKALREMIVEFAGEKIAGRVRGSQGVTVTTTWQDASEWTTKRKAGWVTKVTAPRKAKNVAE